MCLAPNILVTGELVGCRKCWQCVQRRIDDWAGRCIAESKTADASIAITMTYGRDSEGTENHMNACVLTYSDVQKFWKRLRKAGYKFKYLIAGEYGSLKMRAHWHAIIWFTGKVPDLKLNGKMQDWDMWGHGHVVPEPVHINSARYLCKYILKDEQDDHAQSHFAMSKKPPIGTEYFQYLAEKFVQQGLAPQTPEYIFSDITKRNGEPDVFYMSKTVLRDFLHHYVNCWKSTRPDHLPASELVEEFQDKQVEEILTLQFTENMDHGKKARLNAELQKTFEWHKYKKKYDEEGNVEAIYSFQKADARDRKDRW